MSKLSVKGILLGGIADVVATNILAIPIVAYVATKIDLAHTPKEQMQAAILAVMHANPLLFAAQIAVGVGCSILGGYLGARLAKHDELVNGTLSSWLCVGIGVYAMASGKAQDSVFMQLADFIAAPAAGLLGGYLRFKQVRGAAPVGPSRAE